VQGQAYVNTKVTAKAMRPALTKSAKPLPVTQKKRTKQACKQAVYAAKKDMKYSPCDDQG